MHWDCIAYISIDVCVMHCNCKAVYKRIVGLMHWDCLLMISIFVQCLGIKLLMIIIVVKCIGIKLLMMSIVCNRIA